MVGVFKRSVSFTTKINPSASKPTRRHVRSVSLPSVRSSHPLISNLKEEIDGLKTWAVIGSKTMTSGWLCDGLTRLRNVHDSLDDFLQLSNVRASLQACPEFVEKLLDEFLKFVDVYGVFQQSLIGLKEAQLAAHLGMRKRGQSKMSVYAKATRKMDKEMHQLICSIKCVQGGSLNVATADIDEEVAGIIRDVDNVSVMVSSALFNGVCSQQSGRRKMVMPPPLPWMRSGKREKVDLRIEELKAVSTVERMEVLGEAIDDIEKCSERIFRGLIKTRVALLNVLTQ